MFVKRGKERFVFLTSLKRGDRSLSKDGPKISYNAQKKCKKLDAFFGEVKEEEKKK